MLDKLRKILDNKNIRLIIFGETHGFLDDSKIQKDVLKIFKPDIFLYEMLEESSLTTESEKNDFLNEPDDKDFSVISKFGELKNTVSIAKEYNLPIEGMDIKNMLRENKDFMAKTNFSDEEIKEEEKILKKREEFQMQKILSYLNKNNKVFASTGAYHLREDSPLSNIDSEYLIIYPAYNGEQLFEPPEDFDIKNVSFEIMEKCSASFNS